MDVDILDQGRHHIPLQVSSVRVDLYFQVGEGGTGGPVLVCCCSAHLAQLIKVFDADCLMALTKV